MKAMLVSMPPATNLVPWCQKKEIWKHCKRLLRNVLYPPQSMLFSCTVTMVDPKTLPWRADSGLRDCCAEDLKGQISNRLLALLDNAEDAFVAQPPDFEKP